MFLWLLKCVRVFFSREQKYSGDTLLARVLFFLYSDQSLCVMLTKNMRECLITFSGGKKYSIIDKIARQFFNLDIRIFTWRSLWSGQFACFCNCSLD